ncbi:MULTISPECIES: CidA/LrgA family protein [unclassified Erwinia]|uniref:CidA/LrgA family protein n=1 Tax=unclassified Erwinia TaxID=2622719 RepID=UPI0006F569E1|nr:MULTISPECIES: CidA/LrgA family protein [unclassified Erwinia]KQN63739.1 murein hydrolase regulator LrgA [Erwinia sp. Leaf53]PLV57875.1 LrgA [Erwinia sp. B116]
MSRVLLIVFRYCRSFLAIYLCLIAGRGISTLLPVAIPGSIIGMLLLFTLLATQLLPVEWVRPGCQLIIRYMALLFVPISVGIMNDIDILSAQFAPIVVSCLVSTLIVLVTVGLLSERLQRKEGDDV